MRVTHSHHSDAPRCFLDRGAGLAQCDFIDGPLVALTRILMLWRKTLRFCEGERVQSGAVLLATVNKLGRAR